MSTMAVAPIDLELLKLINKLNLSQKEALMLYVKGLTNNGDNFPRQSIEEYNLEIDKAMERIKNGEYISLDDLEKEMESW